MVEVEVLRARGDCEMTRGMEVTMPNGNDLWNNRHRKTKMVWREGKNWWLLDGKKELEQSNPRR